MAAKKKSIIKRAAARKKPAKKKPTKRKAAAKKKPAKKKTAVKKKPAKKKTAVKKKPAKKKTAAIRKTIIRRQDISPFLSSNETSKFLAKGERHLRILRPSPLPVHLSPDSPLSTLQSFNAVEFLINSQENFDIKHMARFCEVVDKLYRVLVRANITGYLIRDLENNEKLLKLFSRVDAPSLPYDESALNFLALHKGSPLKGKIEPATPIRNSIAVLFVVFALAGGSLEAEFGDDAKIVIETGALIEVVERLETLINKYVD